MYAVGETPPDIKGETYTSVEIGADTIETDVIMKVKKYSTEQEQVLEIVGDGKIVESVVSIVDENTSFSTLTGTTFSPAEISLSPGEERFIGGYGFDFGIDGTHLIFSKPIRMEMQVDAEEGSTYEILVKHEGDTKYNTSGLSTKEEGSCDSKGNHSNPGNYSQVIDKKVVFYTCGASSYTMNPTGGNTGTNDVRWIIGDYGQVQAYYNGQPQVYGGNPPASGGGTPSVWPRLRIGTINVGNGGTAWTTTNTVSSQSGNTYTTTNNLTYVTGGRTYGLVLTWVYTAPNKFLTWTYNLTIPTGNPLNVRLYYGQDSYVAGADANDVGYYTTTPTQTVGIFDNVANVLSAQRYISGRTWSGYIATGYNTVQTQTNGGANYTNTIINTAGDNGYGINWDFGTTAGSYTSTTEWRVLPYVSTNVPDVIPGIGQPSPGLQVGVTSQIPFNVTNAGTASSTGVHTMVFNVPTGVNGPINPFVSNAWSCGAQSGATVTCTKNMTLAFLATDSFFIPVVPTIGVQNQTLNFTVNLSNASDSNITNNSASVALQVSVAPSPPDTTPPTVTVNSFASGALLPGGNHTISLGYSDAVSGINTSSLIMELYKWNGSSWGTNIASTGISTGSLSSTGVTYNTTNLSFGKYLYGFRVSDNNANQSVVTGRVFYIDRPEFTVSTGSIDMGTVNSFGNNFSSTVTITVKTLGAGFNVMMNSNSALTYSSEMIGSWNGVNGYGYDQSPFTSNISPIGVNQNIATQGAFLNTNGLQNTYIYNIKIGARTDIDQFAGDYISQMNFGINLTY